MSISYDTTALIVDGSTENYSLTWQDNFNHSYHTLSYSAPISTTLTTNTVSIPPTIIFNDQRYSLEPLAAPQAEQDVDFPYLKDLLACCSRRELRLLSKHLTEVLSYWARRKHLIEDPFQEEG